jgi:hypothetical protein
MPEEQVPDEAVAADDRHAAECPGEQLRQRVAIDARRTAAIARGT